MWRVKMLQMLYRQYRDDPWVQALFQSAGLKLDELDLGIHELGDQHFFDTCTWMLPLYEQMLRITPKATQTLDDRRAAVEAKWKSAGHIDITLLQAIADSWRNGASAVTFEEGFLVITMISVLGVPEDLDTLLDAISAAAPAHLPLRCVLHYLLIRDIHEVMTLEEMQSTKLSNFAMGRYDA